MNGYLVFLFTCMFIMYILAGKSIYDKTKKIKELQKVWPVKHRLDNCYRLQYSVDGKHWTYVMAFKENLNYFRTKDNKFLKAPGLTYVVFDSTKDEEYKSWCMMLNNIKECHNWNSAVIEHYRQALEKFYEENN